MSFFLELFMTDYNEYLNINVLQENKPVTYKSLARSLGIHVNTAKQALYEFSKDQKNVHATYCITGTSLQSDQFNIQLTKESDLEETKKKFKQITGIHVYSVASFDTSDFSMLYTACKDIPKLSLEDRIKCGILKNSKVVIRQLTPARLVGNKAVPAPTGKVPFATPSKTAVATTPANKSSPASTATKRKGTLSFGPATTKKQAVATPTKNEPKPKAVPATPSTATKTQVKAKPDSDDIEKRMAKTTLKASDIFSDDEDDEDDNETEEKPPQVAEDLEVEEDIDMQDIPETETIEEEPKGTSVQPASMPSASVGKARRKVLKKKTTKNARGLLVTEEVWEFESADEDEVESKPIAARPKPAASTKSSPAKKGAAAKKPAAQSNLFSFFKKA